jgi:hypothetical protein
MGAREQRRPIHYQGIFDTDNYKRPLIWIHEPTEVHATPRRSMLFLSKRTETAFLDSLGMLTSSVCLTSPGSPYYRHHAGRRNEQVWAESRARAEVHPRHATRNTRSPVIGTTSNFYFAIILMAYTFSDGRRLSCLSTANPRLLRHR